MLNIKILYYKLLITKTTMTVKLILIKVIRLVVYMHGLFKHLFQLVILLTDYQYIALIILLIYKRIKKLYEHSD